MLFIWYLRPVKYCWVSISLIGVKILARPCPPVKDFILLCGTLLRLVLYGFRFTLFSIGKSLTTWYVFLLLIVLRHASTSWHWSCIQVPFAIFNSVLIFPLISLQSSAPSGSLLVFFKSRGKGCKSPAYCCLKSTPHCGIIQLLEDKPDSWLGLFPWFLKACLESHLPHVTVTSNICTCECSVFDSFNIRTEPCRHQDVVNLVMMYSIWAVSCPPSSDYGVCQHKIVVGCEVKELEPSVNVLQVAEKSTHPYNSCL